MLLVSESPLEMQPFGFRIGPITWNRHPSADAVQWSCDCGDHGEVSGLEIVASEGAALCGRDAIVAYLRKHKCHAPR